MENCLLNHRSSQTVLAEAVKLGMVPAKLVIRPCAWSERLRRHPERGVLDIGEHIQE